MSRRWRLCGTPDLAGDDHATRAARTYGAAADHYDRAALGFWDRFGAATVSRLRLAAGAAVLDLCCGAGGSAIPAARAVAPGGHVLGIDLAGPLLDLARGKAARAGLANIEFRRADATSTSLPSGSFDAVVCVFGVFFTPDRAGFTAEMWRLVRPGGVLAVTTWGPGLFEPASGHFWESVRRAEPSLYRAFSPRDDLTTPEALEDLPSVTHSVRVCVPAALAHSLAVCASPRGICAKYVPRFGITHLRRRRASAIQTANRQDRADVGPVGAARTDELALCPEAWPRRSRISQPRQVSERQRLSLTGQGLATNESAAAPDGQRGHSGGCMDATNGAAHTARAKDEFFAASMYMFHITGFPQQSAVLLREAGAPRGARLDVWRTNPADGRHIPGPGAEGIAFSTPGFSLANSGNRTLHAPKRSWKITLEHAADGGNHLAGMARLNLKSMYNDPSQMREALAWRLFRQAGVPSARHTYAKLAFDATYYGLFSVIEQVDKRFLKDHFGDNDCGNLYKAYCGDVGCATLEHRTGPDGDDSGRQYFRASDDERTYRVKTNKDHDTGTYDDLAKFIRTINGTGLPGGDGRFGTAAFRESVDSIMNAHAFLRWASVNLLLGSWDNYYATPSNYYLYNSGRQGAEDDFMQSPYFTFIPWDYDNSLGIDYFGTKWQYTDILDWPSNTGHYWRDHATSRIPLVQNLLRNPDYRQYYLDYLEFLLDTQFNPDAFGEQIAADSGDGLWGRVCQAAYLESDTPYGQPFTGRQFTNDEVYQSGCKQNELRHGQEKAEGIIHYVRMRRDSARQQLEQLRKATPRVTSGAGFPVTMEPLP